ncbi:hypothetical protein K1W69_24030 [Hoeflea sp. WL0058]|uniref:Uncharacterized protein n=1 Tax=Flavimaribacter sediminis TaxID=2865987 RepID=A0AAE3D2Y9_9HYPH|nr:hypothetical protein [Flavimaribacter sediminis]MBW8640284.1 hypothetical protein [Flavimaribacter sediminis]
MLPSDTFTSFPSGVDNVYCFDVDRSALEGYGGHGIFSYLVLEALSAADADEGGQLAVTEFAAYIETELPEVSFEVFQHRQVPKANVSVYSFSLGNKMLVLSPTAQ